MTIELRIKSKSLEAEAKIIRKEEARLLKSVDRARQLHYKTGANGEFNVYATKAHHAFWTISQHRKRDIRNEARATFLARAYMAGMKYEAVEPKRKMSDTEFKLVILKRVYQIVAKYPSKVREPTDWVWDRQTQRRVPTDHLKEKIDTWAGINKS